jgi:hypothetical protein
MPEMKTVTSAIVHRIGYDEAKQELHVDFHRTGGYVYHGVPPEKGQAALEAPSTGSHLKEHIIGRHRHSDKKAAGARVRRPRG